MALSKGSLFLLLIGLTVACCEWSRVYRNLERNSHIPVNGPIENHNASLVEVSQGVRLLATPTAIFTARDGDQSLLFVITSSGYSAYPTGTGVSVYDANDLSVTTLKYQFTLQNDSYFAVSPSDGGQPITVCALSTYITCYRDGVPLNWTIPFPQAGRTPSLVFINSSLLIATNDNGGIDTPLYMAIDVSNGTVLWNSTEFLSRPAKSTNTGYQFLALNSKSLIAYVPTQNETKGITAIQLDITLGVGNTLWSTYVPQYMFSMNTIVVGDDVVIYSGISSSLQDGYVYCSNTSTGDVLWQLNITKELPSGLAYSQDLGALVVTTTKSIYYYNITTEQPVLMWSNIGFASGCRLLSDVQATIDAYGNAYVCNCTAVSGISPNGTIIFSRSDPCTTQPIIGEDGALLYIGDGNSVSKRGTFGIPPPPPGTTGTTGGTPSSDKTIIQQWWFWLAIGGGVALIAIIVGVLVFRNGKRKTYQQL